MTILTDKNNKAIALLYNNAIIDPGSGIVTGLILGHCVYGFKGQPKGKYFQHVLYNTSGEIVATKGVEKFPEQLDTHMIVYQAWQILSKISEYYLPWIRPSGKWSAQDLQHLLS